MYTIVKSHSYVSTGALPVVVNKSKYTVHTLRTRAYIHYKTGAR